jgi:hypothetical protein
VLNTGTQCSTERSAGMLCTVYKAGCRIRIACCVARSCMSTNLWIILCYAMDTDYAMHTTVCMPSLLSSKRAKVVLVPCAVFDSYWCPGSV